MDHDNSTGNTVWQRNPENHNGTSNENRRIAYFSMEIGIDYRIPTYSGGLGVLAGDMIRSFADLSVPAVAVTLLYKKGYFSQHLDNNGMQQEVPVQWDPRELLQQLPYKISVTIEGRTVAVQAWEYIVKGIPGFTVPVIFLDSDLDENSDYDRHLTDYLYGGDERYRLAQEVILGIGGVRMLHEANCSRLNRYHMNEGHSSLLTLELLNERKHRHESFWDIDGVKRSCVFTTHTPVPAGHDQFSYELVKSVLGDFIPVDFLRTIGGEPNLNMTLLALNLSHYENGVAKEHERTSQEMFPGYHIDSITNGVHSVTWTSPEFSALFDSFISGWRNDPFSLRYALSIPRPQVWDAHVSAKRRLMDKVAAATGVKFDETALTIGFARRATAYKRADLIFHSLDRLRLIVAHKGPVQCIFSGKAHPRDLPGKNLIRKVIETASVLKGSIPVVWLEDYDIELARMMISGCDLWLNTPRKPQEASGTSGMKAAHNGVPSLSILDGWWVEGCIEGLTGWAIGTAEESENDDNANAASLYDKLENEIIPRFYNDRDRWIDMMRHTIAINGSFFNTHRMVQQYVLHAYLE